MRSIFDVGTLFSVDTEAFTFVVYFFLSWKLYHVVVLSLSSKNCCVPSSGACDPPILVIMMRAWDSRFWRREWMEAVWSGSGPNSETRELCTCTQFVLHPPSSISEQEKSSFYCRRQDSKEKILKAVAMENYKPQAVSVCPPRPCYAAGRAGFTVS